jgi:hypothetical protein
MAMVSGVHANRLGPVSKQDAEFIRDLQKTKGQWGYTPDIFPFKGQWAVTMFGERDLALARKLLGR